MRTFRTKAHQAQCANNLKQWGLAVTMYASDNNDRFPDNSDAPDLAWLSPSMITNSYPDYLHKNGYNGPSSSHPGPGGVPTGGNFLFEHGHVEWIAFNGNTNKIAPTAQSAAGLYLCKPVRIGNGPW